MSASVAAELVALARERGVHLWAEAGVLRYRAPAGSLTADLREQLTAYRGDILDLLFRTATRPELTVIPGGLRLLPSCRHCGESDYLPLGDGWRRCWVCGGRWGPGHVPDPGDPPDLPHIARLLGLHEGRRKPLRKRNGARLVELEGEAR